MVSLSRARGALTLAICAAALFVFGSPTHGQPRDAGQANRAEARKWTRVVASVSGSGPAADLRSLMAALATSPELHAVLPCDSGDDPLDMAARLSCDLAVLVSSESEQEGIVRSVWRVVDPGTGEELENGIIEGPAPSSRDLVEFWWIPVVGAVEELLPRPALPGIRIEAAPGTKVTGFTPEPLVIPDSGHIELPRQAPGSYRWRAEAPGAYPARGRFSTISAEPTLVIESRPLRRLSVETSLLMGQFPELWLDWRLARDRVLLKAGASQYLLGLSLIDASSDDKTPSYYSSFPLIQPGIGASAYFAPADEALRPYLSATAFARLLASPAAATLIDPIAPIGSSLSLGAEWAVGSRLGLFVELGLSAYLCESGELMAASVGGYDGDKSFISGDRWFVELPLLKVGLRWTP